MRKISFAEDEYYHIYNRGNNKQQIFLGARDYARFLFYALFFQSTIPLFNIGRNITNFLKQGKFSVTSSMRDKIIENRYTELINFSLMPNHFHLILKEKREGGISRAMQRILDGYTKYFNTKYKKSGHLFQGPFKAVHIKSNTQLLYLSAYIHKNPQELAGWRKNPEDYRWSSYQDYIDTSRWDNLLIQNIILDQFPNKKEYFDFVKTSSAKEFPDKEIFIDIK